MLTAGCIAITNNLSFPCPYSRFSFKCTAGLISSTNTWVVQTSSSSTISDWCGVCDSAFFGEYGSVRKVISIYGFVGTFIRAHTNYFPSPFRVRVVVAKWRKKEFKTSFSATFASLLSKTKERIRLGVNFWHLTVPSLKSPPPPPLVRQLTHFKSQDVPTASRFRSISSRQAGSSLGPQVSWKAESQG